MKVKDLIAMLQNFDGEADVRTMAQPKWPFEYSIRGVVARHQFSDVEEHDKSSDHGGERNGNDMFLLEGVQVRYGAKAAWNEVG